jgi:hypothetical protein
MVTARADFSIRMGCPPEICNSCSVCTLWYGPYHRRESANILALAIFFWGTFHNDGKFRPAWCLGRACSAPSTLYTIIKSKWLCAGTLQLRGKIQSYFSSNLSSSVPYHPLPNSVTRLFTKRVGFWGTFELARMIYRYPWSACRYLQRCRSYKKGIAL